jgi:hypothetical protein
MGSNRPAIRTSRAHPRSPRREPATLTPPGAAGTLPRSSASSPPTRHKCFVVRGFQPYWSSLGPFRPRGVALWTVRDPRAGTCVPGLPAWRASSEERNPRFSGERPLPARSAAALYHPDEYPPSIPTSAPTAVGPPRALDCVTPEVATTLAVWALLSFPHSFEALRTDDLIERSSAPPFPVFPRTRRL